MDVEKMETECVVKEEYKIGDYIYLDLQCEREPLCVGKIEEMQRSSEVINIKVKLYYRRRDIQPELLVVADKYMDCLVKGEVFQWDKKTDETYRADYVKFNRALLLRQLFLTKETLIITPDCIRGHVHVYLLTIVDSPLDVLEKEDNFYFTLAYDVTKKEIHEDKGAILQGPSYQALIPQQIADRPAPPSYAPDDDTLIWSAGRCSDENLDKYLTVTRAVGTFQRTLEVNSNVEDRLTEMSARSCRDTYTFAALEHLHHHNHDIGSAMISLVPGTDRPLRDELDSWTCDEATIFEKALEKYGKNFHFIRQDFLPWKSYDSMVRFFYQWKTTDRYLHLKKIKKAEKQNSMKFIDLNHRDWKFPEISGDEINQVCEGCKSADHSSEWVAWGPPSPKLKICRECAVFWRKYGGLKIPHNSENDEWNTNRATLMNGLKIDEKSFKCIEEGCGKVFYMKYSLLRHQQIVHNQGNKIMRPSPDTLSKRKELGTKKLRRAARRPFISIVPDIYKKDHKKLCMNGTSS